MLRTNTGAAAPPWTRWAGETLLVVVAATVDLFVWAGERELRDGRTIPVWVVPAMSVVVYPILLLRWKYPRMVFLLQWTYALAGLLIPGYGPFTGLLIALYAVARRGAAPLAGLALTACAVPLGVHSYNVAHAASTGTPVSNFVGSMMLWAVLTLTVWGLARLSFRAERRAERTRRDAAAAAVRAERLHLARELHDIVSHSVSAMILQAAGARAVAPRSADQVRGALEAIETTGVQAMDELHRLLGLLRAAGSEDGDQYDHPPSLNDLENLVASVRASGVAVDMIVDGRPAVLDRSVDLAGYRIVQEALTNTVKHAGRGACATVHLRWAPTALRLTIRDTAGSATADRSELSSGNGLTGLAERVALVGGSLETQPLADGFLVRAFLPARDEAPRPGLRGSHGRDMS